MTEDASVDAAVSDVQNTTETSVDVVSADTRRCDPTLGTARPRMQTSMRRGPLDDTLRINQIQVKGTHNSYHIGQPGAPPDWDYTLPTLNAQFDQFGVRKLELDLNWSDDCGRFEVYHVFRFDEGTHCRLFTECLQQIRTWSDAHPGHVPLFIQIEPKVVFRESTASMLSSRIDEEILSVFPRSLVITPDDVQGRAATLNEAVRTNGWPTLGASRGRILFFMNRDDGLRDAYANNRQHLRGRLLFVEGTDTEPFVAVRILNNPMTQFDEIQRSVRAGFLVRTRTEESLEAAWENRVQALARALDSGAQLLSTDFPAPIMRTMYVANIPMGTPARCNPLNAPMGCTPDAVENPMLLAP